MLVIHQLSQMILALSYTNTAYDVANRENTKYGYCTKYFALHISLCVHTVVFKMSVICFADDSVNCVNAGINRDCEVEEDSEEQRQPQSDTSLPNNMVLQWFVRLFLWWQARFSITNAAAVMMLKMIKCLLHIVKHPLSVIFPCSMYLASKYSGRKNEINPKILVVCPSDSCNTLYEYADAYEVHCEVKKAKTCTKLQFKKPCREPLLFMKRLSKLKTVLSPYKEFIFKQPSQWLREMVQCKEFVTLLGQRFRQSTSDKMEDIWDSQVWKDFTDSNGGFLREKYNIALMLFVDWVQPYKRSQYSIGTIYLAILNLPRAQRFLKKWICVVGIIPGPSEPKVNMNTYLKVIVDDLLMLWEGIEVTIEETGQDVRLRAALLCISCDIPAIRKVSQFLSYTANKGCNKCNFTAERECGKGGATRRMSYATRNFNFQLRTKEEVVRQSSEYCKAQNKTSANDIAKKNGVRYSEIHRLPYFDSVKMCAVDSMHALLLGLVKKEITLLLSDTINDDEEPIVSDIDRLRKRIKDMELPSDCGRLPTNLMEKATLDGFTAQQWFTFATVYARPCFFELIPEKFYQSLVLLCEIVESSSKYRISTEEIVILSNKIQEHHKLFSAIYGKWNVSINNHMVLHLPETMLYFGPCHTFWCFASERMNGIITSLPTSGRSIEKEFFHKFARQQKLSQMEISNDLPPVLKSMFGQDCFSALYPDWVTQDSDADTEEMYEHERHIERIRVEEFLSKAGEMANDAFEKQQSIERGECAYPFKDAKLLPPQRVDKIMTDDMYNDVKHHIRQLFDNRLVHVSANFSKYARCQVNGMLLSSTMSRSDRSAYCKVFCAINESEKPEPYFCKVNYFISVTATVRTETGQQENKNLKFAFVTWYRPYGRRGSVEAKCGLHSLMTTKYSRTTDFVGVHRLAARVVPSSIGNKLLVSNLRI